MSNQNNPEHDDEKQLRTGEPSAPSESENTITIRRSRAGSVVILAPAGTAISSSGTEDYMKVVLRMKTGD